MKKKVVIIIPTYNEALIIEDTISQVFDAVQTTQDFDIHILVFDSASQDDTQSIVANLQQTYPKLHLKTEPEKSGLGAAYLAAMHYALDELSTDIVVEFDADLSHQPKYLLPMLEKMDCYDVVVGSRYIKGGSIPKDWGWHRKLLSRLGSITASCFLAKKYKDFTSGFRATSASVLRSILPKKFISNNFAYKLELFYLLHLNNARIVEFPIDFIDRYKGKSKMAPVQIFDSLWVIFKLRFSKLAQYLVMCCIGVIGMFIQMSIFNFSRLFIPSMVAAKLALASALLNNYLLNNRYTFKGKDYHPDKIRTFSLFVAFSILTFVLQIEWLKLTLHLYGPGFWTENVLVILGILLGSVLNYVAYSKVIWKKLSF